jgi:ABC-type lipoprotein export system ATPase subunit
MINKGSNQPSVIALYSAACCKRPFASAEHSAMTAEARAMDLLGRVGIAARAGHRPAALSGGEQQRGAIARALVTEPAVVLADEPTGALDSANSSRVVELLRRLVAERQQTVILVTHDPAVAAAAGRIVRMQDGLIDTDSAGMPRP